MSTPRLPHLVAPSRGVRLAWILSVALLLTGLVTPLALAQGPITPRHTDPTWQAWYWNNPDLSGAPVLSRSETNLDFDWGTGSPDPAVPSDFFSARWQRYIDVTPGVYRFTATSDDGIRVWVDGEKIIDGWWEHSVQTFTADKYLGPGHHLVVVEYFERAGLAVAKLSWQRVPPTITGWKGEYFNNRTLAGAPVLVRDDATIDFDWGTGSPDPRVPPDLFSVRWTRDLDLPAGRYRFRVTVDDGVRLFVNGHLLIDAWRDQPATGYYGDIFLPGGPVTVQMEYYENTGLAVARLGWERLDGTPVPSPTPTPVPTSGEVLVDDQSPGFVRGGLARGWGEALEGYGGHLFWTQNNDRIRPGYNWGRWYPRLTPGRYEVFVFIPRRYTTTQRARYWISHAGGFSLRIVDQSRYNDQWVSLGTYRFRGTDMDYVSLADVTYEPWLSRLMAWDAVKWVPRP